MADAPPTLYFLLGPTAVGKTALALELATLLNAEIVNCDAYCVYRGMDIGTAKPSLAERSRVAHHLIDEVDVTTLYSIGHYTMRCREVVAAIHRRGRAVLVTGGSGFYAASWFAAAADSWAVTDAIKAELESLWQAGGLAAWVTALRAFNPAGLGTLDIHNPRRVGNALARCRASGLSIADLQAALAAQPVPFADCAKRVIILDRSLPELEARIAQRTAAMLEAGLVAEVRQLLDRGLAANPSAASAIGYREVIDHVAGTLPADQLAATITLHTRQLVRKQRSWFRRFTAQHGAQTVAATASPTVILQQFQHPLAALGNDSADGSICKFR
jgi:tRNA dimethylallyltransferase